MAEKYQYPISDIKLHRMKVAPRCQGDGEEQKIEISKLSGTSECSKKLKNDKELRIAGNENKINQIPLSCTLPTTTDLALRLTKTSVLMIPNSELLNIPPTELQAKTIIQLYPKLAKDSHSLSAINFSNQGKKEPKFVPYEPYKACTKPIVKKKCKFPLKKSLALFSRPELNILGRTDESKSDKVSIMVSDFQREKDLWVEEKKLFKSKLENCEKQINQLLKERSALEDQLSIHSQVNNELKRLLVASVGEDVQGKVQCLTEDKARMATMIRHYSEKVDRDYEEKEKMLIQCDIWRSKFLASSVLIDELAHWKGTLLRRLEESKESLSVLLEEFNVTQRNLLKLFKHLQQLSTAFDPMHIEINWNLQSSDAVSLSIEGVNIAEGLHNRLLGTLGQAVGFTVASDNNLEMHTPGQKMARQVLQDIDISIASSYKLSKNIPAKQSILPRFHPDTRFEHITINCSHCQTGEIIVV